MRGLLALVLMVGACAVAGQLGGAPLVVLVLALAFLLGAVALFWSSLLRARDDVPLDVHELAVLAAPSAEAERKTSVLRAIRDIEFERAVGKISEADHAVLSGELRAEAKKLLQQLDEASAGERQAAEAVLVAAPATEVVCFACGTKADPDAAFCKKCGGRIPEARAT